MPVSSQLTGNRSLKEILTQLDYSLGLIDYPLIYRSRAQLIVTQLSQFQRNKSDCSVTSCNIFLSIFLRRLRAFIKELGIFFIVFFFFEFVIPFFVSWKRDIKVRHYWKRALLHYIQQPLRNPINRSLKESGVTLRTSLERWDERRDPAHFARTMSCRRKHRQNCRSCWKMTGASVTFAQTFLRLALRTHVCTTRSEGVTGMYAWLPRSLCCFVCAGFFQSLCNMNVHFVP